jgi:hypothetical protein
VNTYVTPPLKGGITRRNMLTAALPVAGLSLAWAGQGLSQSENNKTNRLGGAWVGDDRRGFRLHHVQIPLDPAGKTAIAHVTPISHAPIPGIDDTTEWNGPLVMTGKDTFEGTIIGYALRQQGLTIFDRIIVGTFVVTLAFTFLDPDTIEGFWWTRFYYPFDGNLLPSGGPDPVRDGPMIMRRMPLVPPPAA